MGAHDLSQTARVTTSTQTDTLSPGATPRALQGPAVRREPWGTTPGGEAVDAYTLVNRNGVCLTAVTLGATITSLRTADRDGRLTSIVLGLPDLQAYLTHSLYVGAVTGRYANRIAGGRFAIDGATHTLTTNDGPNHLHGGTVGFDKRVWTAQRARSARGPVVRFGLTSLDGDEGYPGTVRATVRYLLTHDNRLVVDYTATTTQPTVVNLTQHSYFNLAGERRADILHHELRINADLYTPVGPGLIPLGAHASVDGTPFDFRRATAIGARIDEDHEQLRRARGYDHNFVLRRRGRGLFHAAALHDPASGRTMDVWTTEPGLQLYTSNVLPGALAGADGHTYGPRAGVCLETQHFPDSPNHPEYPSTLLRPGARYRSRTVYAFASQP